MKWMSLLVVCLLVVVAAPLAAQESTPEPDAVGLPACTVEQVEEIEAQIEQSARYLSVVLDNSSDNNLIDITDDLAREQRAYWNWVELWDGDDCAEFFTRAYEFGRIMDEAAIAAGLLSASILSQRITSDADEEDLIDRAERHLRNIQGILRREFPTLDMLVDERYQ